MMYGDHLDCGEENSPTRILARDLLTWFYVNMNSFVEFWFNRSLVGSSNIRFLYDF